MPKRQSKRTGCWVRSQYTRVLVCIVTDCDSPKFSNQYPCTQFPHLRNKHVNLVRGPFLKASALREHTMCMRGQMAGARVDTDLNQHQSPILGQFKMQYPATSAPAYHFQNISHSENKNIPHSSSRANVWLENFHDERMLNCKAQSK